MKHEAVYIQFSLSILAGMLFDKTAFLVLMFKIAFSKSLKFISITFKCTTELNFSGRATIMGWFSYFLIVVYTTSEYLAVFKMLLHSLKSNLSTIYSKKLLIVLTTF